MTTKLQHSINTLTRNKFILGYQESEFGGLRRAGYFMDKVLDSNNIESMKKMMLMQEQVFKQQVHELHRLYNHQKKLMHEVENRPRRRRNETSPNAAERSNTEFDQQSGSNSAGESSRIPIKFDLETPSESTSLKKIEEETEHVEVELTLSIGQHCTRKQRSSKSNNTTTQFTQSQDSDEESKQVVKETGGSSSNKGGGEEYGSNCQENTRPRWLLQDLSLNRT